ncbi:MAG: PilZ domain-containing protein [Pirellulales bacterium]
MLEIDNGQKLMEDLWELTPTKVELPESIRQTFFAVKGAEPLHPDNRRVYHRYFMRAKAVLKRDNLMLGTYTKDVSRQGVAFLSPVPLRPKERIKLRVATAELSLEVTRCRRIDPACFECGAKFAL